MWPPPHSAAGQGFAPGRLRCPAEQCPGPRSFLRGLCLPRPGRSARDERCRRRPRRPLARSRHRRRHGRARKLLRARWSRPLPRPTPDTAAAPAPAFFDSGRVRPRHSRAPVLPFQRKTNPQITQIFADSVFLAFRMADICKNAVQSADEILSFQSSSTTRLDCFPT